MMEECVEFILADPVGKKKTSKIDYSSNFQLPRKVIDDTFINPKRIAAGVPPETQNCLRCHICCKISPEAVYECKGNGHVFCSSCHQFLQDQTCPAGTCGHPLQMAPSAALSKLLRNLTFSCINPTCHEAIGGEDWIRHLDICSSEYIGCPDHRCENELVHKNHFIYHCEKRHQAKLTMEDPFSFQLEKPLDSTAPKNVSIVFVFKVMNRILYLVAQFNNPLHTLMLSCFLIERDVEFARNLRLEVSPVLEKPSDLLVKTTTTINLPGRDTNELKLFGRSAVFIIPELDKMFGFDHDENSDVRQMYCFGLKFKGVNKNVDYPSSIQNLTWSPNPNVENSGWKPMSRDTKRALMKWSSSQVQYESKQVKEFRSVEKKKKRSKTKSTIMDLAKLNFRTPKCTHDSQVVMNGTTYQVYCLHCAKDLNHTMCYNKLRN